MLIPFGLNGTIPLLFLMRRLFNKQVKWNNIDKFKEVRNIQFYKLN